MKLYFGNKNYSSWSLRPWLLMQHFGIPFEEVLVGVAGRGPTDLHRAYSENGLVPCLHLDDGFAVWDTLAIAEYLAETYPQHAIWPVDARARARARCVSAEMHSGFSALRGLMGMNLKMRLLGRPLADLSADVRHDIARVSEIWSSARAQYGEASGEPYLFGAFSAADAMFAPVVWRFYSYNVPLAGAAQAYSEAMLAHPAMRAWHEAALAETDALAHYDDAAMAQFGPAR